MEQLIFLTWSKIFFPLQMYFNTILKIQANYLISNEVFLSIWNNFHLYFAKFFLIDLKCSFWNCKWNQSVQKEKLKFALIKIALILLWEEAAKCPLICRLNRGRASSVFNRLMLNSWIKPQIVQSNVEPTSESSHKTIRFHLSLGSSGSTG